MFPRAWARSRSARSNRAWPCARSASNDSCRNWQVFSDNPCFLLTDHIPMPKKTFNSLERLGTKKISLGPKMLFASQCVVLIHHALDQ